MENFWDKLEKPFLVLAPMEGVTDIIFRQVVARAGAPDVFFTEFTNVSSYASEKGRSNALERLRLAPGEGLSRGEGPDAREGVDGTLSGGVPIVAQIWGKNPEHFAETASALQELGFDGLDINMGCPDKHVNKAGGGAAMIRTPELAVDCIRRAREKTRLPVSVKTRLGFSSLEEFPGWISLLLSQDLAALTVHLRTRKEMSKVPAHYELIPEILRLRREIAPGAKLIINGDIRDRAQALELSARYPEVDGFMIGRGVFQNPYCFTEHQPSAEELKRLFLYHLDLFDLYQPPKFEPLKHFYKVYFSNQPGAAELRARMMECKSTGELREVVGSFRNA